LRSDRNKDEKKKLKSFGRNDTYSAVNTYEQDKSNRVRQNPNKNKNIPAVYTKKWNDK